MTEEGELEAIRKKRMEEIAKKQELISQMKKHLKISVDEKAYDRMMNVLVANQNLFLEATNYAIQYSQRVGRKLTDREVLAILKMFTKKREPKIQFKRK